MLYYIIGILLFSCVIAYVLVITIIEKDNILNIVCDSIILIALIFILILFIISYKAYSKRLKEALKENHNSIIEINSKEITLTRNNQKVNLPWNSIKMVLINKYSIIFFPKDKSLIALTLSTKYKKEVLEEINKINKENLVVDNTNLYK